MSDAAAFEAGLAEVTALVQADGGDLRLVEINDDSAHLELILESAECRECVMPRPFLEQVAFDILRRQVPGLTAVAILDPRETT